jgi:hypothetical protein
MTRTLYQNRVGYSLPFGILAFWLSLLVPPTSSTFGEEKETGANKETKGAAIRVYTDPETGKITKPPADAPPAELSPKLKEAFSTSSKGLVETQSPTPGGGVMIDLKGRFRSPLTATRDSEGKLSIQHVPPEQAPEEEK